MLSANVKLTAHNAKTSNNLSSALIDNIRSQVTGPRSLQLLSVVAKKPELFSKFCVCLQVGRGEGGWTVDRV